MSYGYTLRVRDLNAGADENSIGVRLGRVCIERDIPVVQVAQRLGVTRATVYNWFCGVTAPQDPVVPQVEALITELE